MGTKKKLLFVFNPFSGKAQIKNQLLDIVDVMVKADYEVTIYPTQAQGDAIHKIETEAGDYDLVVCSGGDGTLDEVVTGMMHREKKVPLGYIGLFTEVSYKTSQEWKNVLGHAAYILEGAKCLHDIPSFLMQVEYDNVRLQDEFIYGMISNSTSVGGFKGMTGKDVLLDDGVFEVTLIKKPKNPIELNEIIASLINLVDDTDMIYSFKTSEVRFTAKNTIPWTLDGEFGGDHEEVVVKNLCRAVEIMVPQGE